MFYLLGLAIFLFSVALGALLLTGDLRFILDIPTFILLILPLVAVLTATQNFKIFAVGFKAAILPKSNISDDMRGKAASLFRFLSKATALIMTIHILVSLIMMLTNIDFGEPESIYRIGSRNISAILVTPLYGLIFIAAIFEPIVIILKKRGDKDRK